MKTPIQVSLGDGSREERACLPGPSESHLELAPPACCGEPLSLSMWPEQIRGLHPESCSKIAKHSLRVRLFADRQQPKQCPIFLSLKPEWEETDEGQGEEGPQCRVWT